MLTKQIFQLSAIGVAIGGLLVASQVNSHSPGGVPVTTLPLTCTAPASGGWTITLVPVTGSSIPTEVECTGSGHSGKCSKYKYTVQNPVGGTNPDHVVFAVSADQDLDFAGPQTPGVQPPGSPNGDSTTGFLFLAQHEYPVRVNAAPLNPAEISIVGPSTPRISTVLVKKGKLTASCLIAGPGIPGNVNAVTATSTTFSSPANNCPVIFVRNAAGVVTDVLPGPGFSGCSISGPLPISNITVDNQALHFAGDGVSTGGVTILGSTDKCTTYILSTGFARKVGTHC